MTPTFRKMVGHKPLEWFEPYERKQISSKWIDICLPIRLFARSIGRHIEEVRRRDLRPREATVLDVTWAWLTDDQSTYIEKIMQEEQKEKTALEGIALNPHASDAQLVAALKTMERMMELKLAVVDPRPGKRTKWNMAKAMTKVSNYREFLYVLDQSTSARAQVLNPAAEEEPREVVQGLPPPFSEGEEYSKETIIQELKATLHQELTEMRLLQAQETETQAQAPPSPESPSAPRLTMMEAVISPKLASAIIPSATHDHSDHVLYYTKERKGRLEIASADFVQWLRGTNSEKSCVYWLWQHDDDPGSDDLAYFIADQFHKGGALTSAFFFPKGEKALSQTQIKAGFAPTLALGSTRSCKELRPILTHICEDEDPFVLHRKLGAQIDALFLKPHKNVDALPSEYRTRPLFVILSGLDRCPPAQGRILLEKVVDCVRDLPISFLITSRRAPWVTECFGSSLLRHVTVQRTYVDPLEEVGDDTSISS